MPSELALLGTAGIQDPNVRNFLDRFLQVWNQKMSGPDAMVSRSELSDLTVDALTQALGGGALGGPPSAEAINSSIDTLARSLRSSLIQQALEQNMQPKIEELLQQVGNGVSEGMSNEVTERSTQTGALASAINRIWASIGGSTAVIEDGRLASATPSSAVADKWNTVIAAVTDPNTGNVSSASILTETRTYANSANSTFNAIYTVRASVSAGGQTVAGGFGLAATGGAGSAQGPSIDFGVLANKFYIAAPASGYNPVTEYGSNLSFPFIVVTTPTTINGKTYPAGVYMKRAVIGQATIGSAEIADAAIINAKISGTISSDDWTGAGGSGWAIVKSGGGGNAWFNNIYARGDIQANSLTANVVNTANIVGAAVTSTYSASSSVDPSVVVSTSSGDRSLVIIVYTGTYIDSIDGGEFQCESSLIVNGANVATFLGAGVYSVDAPSGSYTISVNHAANNPSHTPARVVVLHTKR